MFKALRLIIPFLLLLTISIAGYVITSDHSKSTEASQPDLSYESDCFIRASSCTLNLLDGLDVHLGINPAAIEPLERFQITLSIVSNEPDALEDPLAWVEGRDMEMGQHFMSGFGNKIDPKTEVVLTGMVPICTVDANMVWRFVLDFRYQGKLIRVHSDLRMLQHKV